MTSYLDKLNLTPMERRLVVMTVLVIFALINFWFVFPVFGELGRTQQRLRDDRAKLAQFQAEVDKLPIYEEELKRLQASGAQVAPEEYAIELTKAVLNQASRSGVFVSRSQDRGPSSVRTNMYFIEKTVVIDVLTGERELVDFLHELGSSNSLIRARNLTLSPDPSRMKLQGPITLVASYPRRQPAKRGGASAPAATAPTPTAASNPAARTRTPPSVSPKPAAAPVPNGPGAPPKNQAVIQTKRGASAEPPTQPSEK